jgi:hypothetical protein
MARRSIVHRISTGTGWAAILAGFGWIAKDIGGRLSPDPDYWDCNSSYDYALNAIDTMAFILLVPAVVGLFRAYRASEQTRIGVAALGSAAGFGVAGIANLLEHCAGMDALGFAYVIGAMIGFLLLLIFAVALTRVRLMPTWASRLLVVGTAAGLLLANQVGLVVFGLVWVVLGSVCTAASRPEQRVA